MLQVRLLIWKIIIFIYRSVKYSRYKNLKDWLRMFKFAWKPCWFIIQKYFKFHINPSLEERNMWYNISRVTSTFVDGWNLMEYGRFWWFGSVESFGAVAVAGGADADADADADTSSCDWKLRLSSSSSLDQIWDDEFGSALVFRMLTTVLVLLRRRLADMRSLASDMVVDWKSTSSSVLSFGVSSTPSCSCASLGI